MVKRLGIPPKQIYKDFIVIQVTVGRGANSRSCIFTPGVKSHMTINEEDENHGSNYFALENLGDQTKPIGKTNSHEKKMHHFFQCVYF